MTCQCLFHRRGAFKFAGAFAAACGFLRSAASAQTAPASNTVDAQLPTRGEFIVRGGHVLTMDPVLGDLPVGDVHVRDGAIVAVGTNSQRPRPKLSTART